LFNIFVVCMMSFIKNVMNEAVNYYKSYRNKLTILIRKAKEQYYINRIEICKGNGREIWKDIYPTSTPKSYLNIVNSYSTKTGNRLLDNNFLNITNNKSSINSNFKFKTIGRDNVILPIVHIINCSITNGPVPDELSKKKLGTENALITSFDDNALKWFTSYLNNRQQLTTTIGPHYSNNCYAKYYGVTQGTSLGPILFLLYIKSIYALLLKCKLFVFADDIAL
ncbi:neuroblastoma-amplified sequence-like, partial [Aphis craccivora]